jgi:hypothetical protein
MDFFANILTVLNLSKTNLDALANSFCHARMSLSGSHYINELEPGFPLRIAAGMTLAIKSDS